MAKTLEEIREKLPGTLLRSGYAVPAKPEDRNVYDNLMQLHNRMNDIVNNAGMADQRTKNAAVSVSASINAVIKALDQDVSLFTNDVMRYAKKTLTDNANGLSARLGTLVKAVSGDPPPAGMAPDWRDGMLQTIKRVAVGLDLQVPGLEINEVERKAVLDAEQRQVDSLTEEDRQGQEYWRQVNEAVAKGQPRPAPKKPAELLPEQKERLKWQAWRDARNMLKDDSKSLSDKLAALSLANRGESPTDQAVSQEAEKLVKTPEYQRMMDNYPRQMLESRKGEQVEWLYRDMIEHLDMFEPSDKEPGEMQKRKRVPLSDKLKEIKRKTPEIMSPEAAQQQLRSRVAGLIALSLEAQKHRGEEWKNAIVDSAAFDRRQDDLESINPAMEKFLDTMDYTKMNTLVLNTEKGDELAEEYQNFLLNNDLYDPEFTPEKSPMNVQQYIVQRSYDVSSGKLTARECLAEVMALHALYDKGGPIDDMYMSRVDQKDLQERAREIMENEFFQSRCGDEKSMYDSLMGDIRLHNDVYGEMIRSANARNAEVTPLRNKNVPTNHDLLLQRQEKFRSGNETDPRAALAYALAATQAASLRSDVHPTHVQFVNCNTDPEELDKLAETIQKGELFQSFCKGLKEQEMRDLVLSKDPLDVVRKFHDMDIRREGVPIRFEPEERSLAQVVMPAVSERMDALLERARQQNEIDDDMMLEMVVLSHCDRSDAYQGNRMNAAQYQELWKVLEDPEARKQALESLREAGYGPDGEKRQDILNSTSPVEAQGKIMHLYKLAGPRTVGELENTKPVREAGFARKLLMLEDAAIDRYLANVSGKGKDGKDDRLEPGRLHQLRTDEKMGKATVAAAEELHLIAPVKKEDYPDKGDGSSLHDRVRLNAGLMPAGQALARGENPEAMDRFLSCRSGYILKDMVAELDLQKDKDGKVNAREAIEALQGSLSCEGEYCELEHVALLFALRRSAGAVRGEKSSLNEQVDMEEVLKTAKDLAGSKILQEFLRGKTNVELDKAVRSGHGGALEVQFTEHIRTMKELPTDKRVAQWMPTVWERREFLQERTRKNKKLDDSDAIEFNNLCRMSEYRRLEPGDAMTLSAARNNTVKDWEEQSILLGDKAMKAMLKGNGKGLSDLMGQSGAEVRSGDLIEYYQKKVKGKQIEGVADAAAHILAARALSGAILGKGNGLHTRVDLAKVKEMAEAIKKVKCFNDFATDAKTLNALQKGHGGKMEQLFRKHFNGLSVLPGLEKDQVGKPDLLARWRPTARERLEQLQKWAKNEEGKELKHDLAEIAALRSLAGVERGKVKSLDFQLTRSKMMVVMNVVTDIENEKTSISKKFDEALEKSGIDVKDPDRKALKLIGAGHGGKLMDALTKAELPKLDVNKPESSVEKKVQSGPSVNKKVQSERNVEEQTGPQMSA